jgi:GT2 family glycosyltransferase
MMRPIHVVIVAFHAADQLDMCLAALGTRFETTIVDNSSSSAVKAVALRRGTSYIDTGRNIGFGAGANLAVQRILHGPPRDVLLLNPDTNLDPCEVEKLSAHLHRLGANHLAAVAPRLVDSSGAEQRIVWPFPTPTRAWTDAIGFGRRLPPRDTFVIGAVILLRWEALKEVGLFDERFFLYAEETDWQRRALELGWTTALCREASGSHVGGGTSDDPRTREALFHAAHETYIRKWHGRTGWLMYRTAACAGAAARAVVLGGDRRAEAARRARIYARGPCHCAESIHIG